MKKILFAILGIAMVAFSSCNKEDDDNATIEGYSWNAGNLNAQTLELGEGFAWYSMKVTGKQAESNLCGIEGLVFNKVK